MKKSYDEEYKVVLVGSSGVGKSSLLIRFVDDQFKGDLLATIGVDFRFRTLEVDGRKVKLQIWDTAGQETFRTIISAYYKGADSIPSTFKDVKQSWKAEIAENKEQYCKIMLIGNKADLQSENRPTQQQIDQLKSELGTDLYFQTSAKSGTDVVKAFTQLSRVLKGNRSKGSQRGEVVLQQKPKVVEQKKKCC